MNSAHARYTRGFCYTAHTAGSGVTYTTSMAACNSNIDGLLGQVATAHLIHPTSMAVRAWWHANFVSASFTLLLVSAA